MTDGNNDTARRVTATANRLRMIQIDFADQSEAVRKEYLAEEVQRALAAVAPEQRQAFLKQLQERFPTWDRIELGGAAATSGATSPPTTTSNFNEKELKDWTFLVERLVQLAPSLSAQAKQSIVTALAGAGLAPAGKGGWSAQHGADLKTKLQLGAAEQVDPNRGAELLDMLAEFAGGLDLLVWNTWKQIAPQSDIRRTTPLPKVAGRFAAGDQNVPRGQVAQDINRLRKLTAAMISAVGQVGHKFGEDYVNQFAPPQIEDLVKAQGGGGIFASQKVKCWEQYVEMSASRDATAIEHEIMAAVAEYTEKLFKGLR